MHLKKKWLLIILNSAGILISLYSFIQTERLNNYISGSRLICDIGNIASCTTTYISDFAYLLNIPISFFALLFFWFIVYSFAVNKTNSVALKDAVQFIGFLNVIGAIFCCFYLYILIFVLKNLCISCLLIDLIVFTNFIILFNPLKIALRSLCTSLKGFLLNTRGIAISLLILTITGLVLFQAYRIILNNKNKVYLEAFYLQKPISSSIKNYHAITWGNKDALTEIKIFEDYLCRYCKIASSRYRELFKKDNSNVKITFICYPLAYKPNTNRFNIFIAKVMTAASEDPEFWEFHDKIINQASGLDSSSIFEIAREELKDYKYFNENFMFTNFDSIFNVNISLAKEYQVKGTPAIYINNRELEQWTNISLLNMIIDYQP